MEAITFRNSYEFRIWILLVIASVYVWPGQWFLSPFLYILGRLVLEAVDTLKPFRGRLFKRGPHEEAELALHRVLLHGAIFLVLAVLILDHLTIDYVRDLYRVLILVIAYVLVGLCQFGSSSFDEAADPPRDVPRLDKPGID